MVRKPAFHAGNAGSIPVPTSIYKITKGNDVYECRLKNYLTKANKYDIINTDSQE